jgi:hypothetical protein
LDEVSYALLQSTSRDVDVGDMDLLPMPSCIPTSSTVLVRNLCALAEALSRDLKPIWTKQYVALRSNLIAVSAHAHPWNCLSSKEGSLTRRKSRKSDDSTALTKVQSRRDSRTLSTRLSNWWREAQIIFILTLWIVAFFCS